MLHRSFPHNQPTLSDSIAIERFADTLGKLKSADRLTDAAVGEILGRGMDQARLYRLGDTEIGMVGLLRAIDHWGEALNPVLALTGFRLTCVEAEQTCDMAKGVTLASALHRVLDAVRDGTISGDELRGMSAEITEAGAVMDELRSRLAVA